MIATRLLFALLGLFLLALVLLEPSAQAASFDCAKAAHPLEKIVCANPDLSKKDEEIAKAYRARLALFFDKHGLRDDQRAWQRSLRARCDAACGAQDVSDSYDRRLAILTDPPSEEWEVNYKTNDALGLSVRHWEPGDPKTGFDFTLWRFMLNNPDESRLCLLDAEEGKDPPFAQLLSATKAKWSDGKGCTLDFALTREADGNVPRIDIVASPQCRRYCRDKRYTLDDSNFIPNNDYPPSD